MSLTSRSHCSNRIVSMISGPFSIAATVRSASLSFRSPSWIICATVRGWLKPIAALQALRTPASRSPPEPLLGFSVVEGGGAFPASPLPPSTTEGGYGGESVDRLVEDDGTMLEGCWKPLLEGGTSTIRLRRLDGGPSVTIRSRLVSKSRDMAATNALLPTLARLACGSSAKIAGAKLIPLVAQTLRPSSLKRRNRSRNRSSALRSASACRSVLLKAFGGSHSPSLQRSSMHLANGPY